MTARIQVSSLILGLSVFGSVGISHAATYYVDFAAGSDANNGTSTGTPWKRCPGDASATGTAVATALQAGDAVKFKGGVVYLGGITLSRSGSSGSPITYDGNHAGDWGSGRAVIDRQYLANLSCLAANAGISYINVKGFELRNAGGWADNHQDVIDAAAGTKTNTVNTGGMGASFYGGSHTNIYLDNLYIHRIGGWRNTIGWSASTIGGAGIAFKSPYGVTITNCEVTKAHTAIGIYASLTANQVEIVGCDLHDYIVWGVDVAPFGNNGVLRNINIRDTRIRDYAQFTAGNWRGVGEWPHTDGVFLRNAGYTGSTWSNVNVFNMHFYCDTPGASQGGTASIFISEGPSANVFNNLFNSDPQTRVIGVEYANAGGGTNVVRIYNNTFISLSPAIIMADETSANRRQVYIQNNIFRKPDGSAANSPMVTRLSGVTPIVMNNNLYYDPDWSASTKYVAAFPGYTYFVNFLASYGFENNGIYADPKHISATALPSARLLQLASGSPAIGAGANLSAYFTTDKAGQNRPASGAWDIGAFQYQAGGLSPAAASGLAGAAVSSTQANLTWTDNAGNETGFKIERRLTSGASYVQIAMVGANIVSYSDNGLVGGTAYTYRVRASNGSGDSAYSNEASTVTPSAASVGTVGVMLDASAATIVSPYQIVDGAIFQSTSTDDLSGGKATFPFDVAVAGVYAVVALVDAPTTANDSIFINVDAEPLNPASVWHIPVTTGFQERVASWQGSGSWAQPEFVPKYFSLTIGQHEVVVRNREPNTRIKAITIQKRPSPGGNLSIANP